MKCDDFQLTYLLIIICNIEIYVLTLNLDNIFPILRKFGFSIFVGSRRNETTESGIDRSLQKRS